MNEIVTQKDATLEIIKSAPDALLLNEDQVTKTVDRFNDLLARIKKEGMTDELDALANKYLIRCKEVLAEVSDRRKPLTQMFDQIRKQFTELEALLDPNKKGSVYDQLQTERNTYATWKIEQQRKADAERERKLKAEQERISLKSEADIQLNNGFISYLSQMKNTLTNVFNRTTLENYLDSAQTIYNFPEIYAVDKFNALPVNIRAMYLNQAEVEIVITNARIGKFDAWCEQYRNEIRALKIDLTEKLQGKKRELEAIEEQRRQAEDAAKKAAEAKNEADRLAAAEAHRKADEERIRLEMERAEREKREAEAAAEADRLAKLKAEQDAEAQKNIEQTELMFNATAESVAENKEVKVVENWEIEVTNPAGWMEIFRFWMNKEGMKKSNADIEKKTCKQMKSFAEAWAKKHDESINSPYIKYSPVYKVRNEK